VKLVLKILISVALLIILFFKINFKELAITLSSVKPLFLVLPFLIFVFQHWLIAFSWYIILKAQKHNVSLSIVLQIHFIGNFWGMFLPTSIAMDIIRAYNLSKHLTNGVDAASSMFFLRVVGFLILFVLALIVSIVFYPMIEDKSIIFVIVLSSLLFISLVTAIFSRIFRELFEKILNFFKLIGVKKKLLYFYNSTLKLSSNRNILLKIILISLIVQAIGILGFFLVGVSLSLPVNILYYFLYFPIIQVIILIPISIAGIGVRESAIVYFFSQIGTTRPEAFSLSILIFGHAVAIALLGGVIYWISAISWKK
jgi:uncharacterized protein (TIRG00374 family)